MHLITTAALACVPAASDATLRVGIAHHGANRTSTSDLAMTVDALQDEHGGPSIDAAAAGEHDVIHIVDFRTENRWPAFSAAVTARTPVLSAASYRLHIGRDDTIGSLSMYATKPHAFDAAAVRTVGHLCTYAGVVLAFTAEQDRTRNLEIALRNSRDIGAAISIVMTRHLVTRQRAFELLSSASQHCNRKMRDLAEEVILTGDLAADGIVPRPARPTTASWTCLPSWENEQRSFRRRATRVEQPTRPARSPRHNPGAFMARTRNTLIRSLHDVGLAAWFGGSLMGAVGLNGASQDVRDPVDRLRVASAGWGRGSPVAAVAIGAHLVGGAGLVSVNRGRVRSQSGVTANTVIKTALTGVAIASTAYSGVLGAKLATSDQPAQGATKPADSTSPEAAKLQQQQRLLQWITPAVTGVLVVLGAQQGEQQRPTEVLRGVAAKLTN